MRRMAGGSCGLAGWVQEVLASPWVPEEQEALVWWELPVGWLASVGWQEPEWAEQDLGYWPWEAVGQELLELSRGWRPPVAQLVMGWGWKPWVAELMAGW